MPSTDPSGTAPFGADLDPRCLRDLAGIAADAIRHAFDEPADPAATGRAFRGAGASFVTLRQHGRLRGCMGTLEAHRALGEDVANNARAAAFRDPRFAPLTRGELSSTDVEVSVLSPHEPVAFADEAALLAALRPGIDGVVLAHAGRRATYLPGVWAQLPEPHRFLAQLRAKAGIEATVPCEALSVWRYTAAHSAPRPLEHVAPQGGND